ncbi:spondin-2-like [Ylistrum balloti]|uniref:spondin-2-like n=1 Tax=Ylistrum balloti TaxID=509963 RepID=UPI002905ECFB|nr:spondin-2-like [Ylistrum balloti]
MNVHLAILFLSAIGVVLVSYVDSRPRKAKRRGRCQPKMLAEYNLTFYGDWSPKTFPRFYPRVRPPAQWSKLVGRSHDSTYQLWTLGGNASDAVKAFAEDADSSTLDQDAQAYRGIFDSFTAAPIESGMGRSAVRFLADGQHTKMSFLVKIVPSPDWFVGVASLDLCRNGRWRKEITVDLAPLDAGTDQGLTFTSPNWPNVPTDPISEITNTQPNHPASAFFYPEKETLPRIGHIVITEVAEYRRRGRKLDSSPTGPNVVIFDPEEDEDYQYYGLKTGSLTQSSGSPHEDEGGKPQDCTVSEWSEWSPCSKTCGFGIQTRSRDVILFPVNGGYGCPKLTEQNTCGSMRKCKWGHFDYLFKRSG